MKTNESLRPAIKVLDTETGIKYTVDSIAMMVNRELETLDDRLVAFHETDHYDKGLMCMNVKDFRNRFITAGKDEQK